MKTVCLSLIVILFVSCASVSSVQKMDIAEWKGDDVYQEVKSPGAAAGLNLLLGIGDFYNGNIGYGIANLLTWPFSMLWAPVGGYNGALVRNWEETTIYLRREERKKTASKKEKKKEDIAEIL